MQRVQVLEVDQATGACIDAYSTPGIEAFRALGEAVAGGSAPIRLPGLGFLAVAHTRVLVGATRRTFFYLYEEHPPFTILAVTPRLLFFNATIEYATGLVRRGHELIVAMGIDDCYSRYVTVGLCPTLRRLTWREPLKRDLAKERALCAAACAAKQC